MYLYHSQSQNLIRSKLNQDPSSQFIHEDLASSISIILLKIKQTNRQLNGHEFNTSSFTVSYFYFIDILVHCCFSL